MVDYGFRLPSAKDNRPLNFDEFESKINQVMFVSATPGEYELSLIHISYWRNILKNKKIFTGNYYICKKFAMILIVLIVFTDVYKRQAQHFLELHLSRIFMEMQGWRHL